MLITPTTLTAYQLILTEPELRAAIANPAMMLPHYRAALTAKPDRPGADLSRQLANGATDTAAKPGLRTVAIRIHSNEWIAFCTEFAKLYPDYLKNDGQPDMYHIGLGVLHCGYTEVTKDNFGQVVEALISRAQESHPAPV